MRVVFFGTPELAVPSLAAVAQRHEVTATVCQPDRPKGRGKKVIAPPVKQWALEHGITVHQPTKLNDGAFEGWLREQAPDVCAIAAYGRILKQPIIDVPPQGFINMHPSLLPKYRGPSPIQSAILNGERMTGISIMKLVLDMDAGPIILQEEAPIRENETAVELTERLAERGGVMLAEGVAMIEDGTATFTPQDDRRATYCGMLSKEDGYIDWTAPAAAIHNLVRGAQPWPMAQCRFRGEVCKVHMGRPIGTHPPSEPGVVVAVEKDAVHVATGDGAYAITKFQPPGKRPMDMGAYLLGQPVEPGEWFEAV